MTPSDVAVPNSRVRLFHASLVWPLPIEPLALKGPKTRHWEVLDDIKNTHAWRRIDDEFTEDPGPFCERHYREFVSFLPYVQRLLLRPCA